MLFAQASLAGCDKHKELKGCGPAEVHEKSKIDGSGLAWAKGRNGSR
jgi:hypothetical protein